MRQPTVISVYAGAGGLDLGFHQAGYRTVWANEKVGDAAATWRSTLGDVMVEGDIDMVPFPDIAADVVIGGPPCQGFSVAGKRDPVDPRSNHVHRLLDMVEHVRPAMFVMENVKALYNGSRWLTVRESLLERADKLGYHTTMMLLDASDYGVAQRRERMFLVGTRDRPATPPQQQRTPTTVRELFGGLPDWGAPGNNTNCAAKITPLKKPVLRSEPWAGMLFNGPGRPINPDRAAPTMVASMGGNATPVVDQANLDDPTVEPWVVEYHRGLVAGGRPATSIPDRLRRITVEEAAAIQSFPSNMTFTGSTTSKFRQIGNAVPPELARHLAQHLRSHV